MFAALDHRTITVEHIHMSVTAIRQIIKMDEDFSRMLASFFINVIPASLSLAIVTTVEGGCCYCDKLCARIAWTL